LPLAAGRAEKGSATGKVLPPKVGVKKRVALATSDSSAGGAPDPSRALAALPGRLLGKAPPARANLAQRRIDDDQRSRRAIQARPTATSTTAPVAVVSPLIGIEAPHADDEAGEHSASNHG
jgi:hypothetical protein